MKPDLERAIDEVGREEAFAAAEAYGWQRGEPVPTFVWWRIVTELRKKKKLAS